MCASSCFPSLQPACCSSCFISNISDWWSFNLMGKIEHWAVNGWLWMLTCCHSSSLVGRRRSFKDTVKVTVVYLGGQEGKHNDQKTAFHLACSHWSMFALYCLDRASPGVSFWEGMTGLVILWDGIQKVVPLMYHNTQRPKLGTCRGLEPRIKPASWASADTRGKRAADGSKTINRLVWERIHRARCVPHSDLPSFAAFSSAFCTSFTDTLVQAVCCSYKRQHETTYKYWCEISGKQVGGIFFPNQKTNREEATSRKEDKTVCFLRYPLSEIKNNTNTCH